MKKLLLALLMVLFSVSIGMCVDEADQGHPWEDEKENEQAVHEWMQKTIDVLRLDIDRQQKIDRLQKLLELLNPIQAGTILRAVIGIYCSQVSNDDCVECLYDCGNEYSACLAGCDFFDTECQRKCLYQIFLPCIIDCDCEWYRAELQ